MADAPQPLKRGKTHRLGWPTMIGGGVRSVREPTRETGGLRRFSGAPKRLGDQGLDRAFQDSINLREFLDVIRRLLLNCRQMRSRVACHRRITVAARIGMTSPACGTLRRRR